MPSSSAFVAATPRRRPANRSCSICAPLDAAGSRRDRRALVGMPRAALFQFLAHVAMHQLRRLTRARERQRLRRRSRRPRPSASPRRRQRCGARAIVAERRRDSTARNTCARAARRRQSITSTSPADEPCWPARRGWRSWRWSARTPAASRSARTRGSTAAARRRREHQGCRDRCALRRAPRTAAR